MNSVHKITEISQITFLTLTLSPSSPRTWQCVQEASQVKTLAITFLITINSLAFLPDQNTGLFRDFGNNCFQNTDFSNTRWLQHTAPDGLCCPFCWRKSKHLVYTWHTFLSEQHCRQTEQSNPNVYKMLHFMQPGVHSPGPSARSQ
jgi:hypothetical protein